ncbi:Outer membrane protein beta-barrel domain-containing protein [Flavobacterium gillisiae]|uniref:Outer membrane protein beta-barrel domain-containing protein n=1 Tax=Flavobacterium gillisiae TaxID=150146 RepID=A0A1H3Z6M9_9FLAO|nr:outer membrane beta-barrel protein [Flavobacterium gillisiae]SEA19297.1 Outer membrane protein beta-barrel domain-containing protein [Flavobacterium gillisiae]
MKKLYFTSVLILVACTVFAQYGYRDSNRIGISFGANQLTMNTDNFQTKPDLGWNAGLSVRGNFYDNWDMVYALQFSENNFSVATRKLNVQNVDVNYKLASAQISLQLSYILVENILSVEFGPVVQVNGKFKIDYEEENNTINGTALLAKDIVDISKFNFYPTVGITAGVRHFRFNVSYQYGINNMLDNLNTKQLGVNFNGNPGILNGNVILYL